MSSETPFTPFNDPDSGTGSLFRRSVRGAQIITVISALTSVFQLGAQVALMRLLDPEVFGAAAYIVIIVGMARLLTFQSHKAIIQRKNDIKRLMDNAFTAEFFIAFVAFLALFFAAGPLMRRSNEWYFIRELQVAALGVFAGPLMIPKAILEKRLEFAKANYHNVYNRGNYHNRADIARAARYVPLGADHRWVDRSDRGLSASMASQPL